MREDIVKRLRANAAKRDTLSRERDELILEAKAAGMTIVRIAEAVGLTRQQIHRIIRDHRPAT